jgi:hypothetical protein
MSYEVIVSRSGTRHIVGRQVHQFRISTLCEFGIKPEEALLLSQAVCDCPFCLAEAEEQRRNRVETNPLRGPRTSRSG